MNNEVKQLHKQDVDPAYWTYEFQQRAEQPILLCDFFCRSLSEYLLPWVVGESEKYNILFTDTSKGYSHIPQRHVLFDGLRKQLDDSEWLFRFLKSSREFPKDFNREAEEVNEAVKDPSITNQTLATYWNTMDASFLKLVPWFFYPYYVSSENMLTDRVRSGLERYRKDIERIVDLDEALMAVVFPRKKTAFQSEQEDMVKLVEYTEHASNFLNDGVFTKMASDYLDKYDWLTTFILTPLLPMTYSQLIERVEKAREGNIVANHEIQKDTLIKNAQLANKIRELVKDDASLIFDIDQACELAYVLTAGIEEAYKSSSRYLTFMQLVATRIGVSFTDLKYLLSREIVDALVYNKSIPSEVIRERTLGFVMMTKNGTQYLSVGSEGKSLSEWIDRVCHQVDTTVTELRGNPACKGYSKAKVRVVNNPTDAHGLLEGEVLVCPMTNPDYVPAIRRSSAIITDEGGLLSHAAIMSREFGKPCIIGTKIATQVLRDGDLVEVDADNGVARVLERATK
jgi:phosphohistidine swiveling domain-containing protein